MTIKLSQLKQYQGLPLEGKVILSQQRIRQFYDHFMGEVYVSFSGGKDSTVLLHLVREMYPNVPAVFVDTGLEYPEIREFVRSVDNVVWLKPKMPFNQVIEKYGYPVVSKKTARMVKDLQNPTENNKVTRHFYLTGIKKDGTKGTFKLAKKWRCLIDAPFRVADTCCDVIKKRPFKLYHKETGRQPFIGTMASDGDQREATYLKRGCNAFTGKIQSTPMAFWMESDIWDYINTREIPYSSVYDTGVRRTGCMFCMFGVHLEKGLNRFQRMQSTHPKQWDYCINKLGCGKVLDYIGVPYAQEDDLFNKEEK